MLIFKRQSLPKIQYLLKLMLPLVTSQLAIMLMSFFDTAMSGKYSPADLAGVAVGSNVWTIAFTALSGVLMAATPLIANFYGAGDHAAITRVVRKGLCLALGISITLIGLGFLMVPVLLNQLGLEPTVYHVATYYLLAIAAGATGIFLSVPLRSLVDSLGYTNISMRIHLLAVPVNAVLNYCFIFGACGMPAMGGIGAGITTAVSCWLVFFLYLYNLLCVKPFKTYGIFQLGRADGTDAGSNASNAAAKVGTSHAASRASSDGGASTPVTYLAYLKLGIPLGMSIVLETSVFGVTAFLVAKFGTAALAAHQAALNFATLIYMFPMGFSLALTIVIGARYGAKKYQSLREFTRIGLELSMTLGLFYIIVELIACQQIASLYSNDAEVIGIITTLIYFACIWQLGDMVCAPCQGITRGMKDVNSTMYAMAIGYWAICLPLGYLLDRFCSMGLYSYWTSLDIGVLTSTVVMLVRLRHDLRKMQS